MAGVRNDSALRWKPNDAEQAMAELRAEYPHFKKLGIRVDDQRGKPHNGPGQSEYFGPQDEGNPFPGDRSVQVYNPDQKGQRLKNLLFGEHFHALGQEDEGWKQMKQNFYNLYDQDTKDYFKYKHSEMSLPQDQRTNEDIKKYYPDYVENRSFDDWMNNSELDQRMGDIFFPTHQYSGEDAPRWSPEHKALKEKMLEYLRGR